MSSTCSSVPTLLDLFSERMVEVLVDRFYKYNLRDRNIKHFFKGVNMEHLKSMQTKYLLHVLGGKQYNGRSMRAAHKRLLDFKDKHFDSILKNLTKAMKDIKLSDPIIKLVLSSAESTRDEVLGR
ncbi:globin-like protein [Basidiobolus meristosporus CBS 931.73]|uniref:Globin-like protein n=1 Tax=Basidiobolus meristosporus CBS 931.73 TaxID=1314790 RepID=A0A1Y1Y9W2_9FUNG|nr:globin-like protein [Basidiobolus meristosporus CBS 931.73]|eukprot:ORX94797.1 globin-like protein [Basidiobolus meristosporus CBS 931.73]